MGIFGTAFGHQVQIVDLFASYGLANVLAALLLRPGGLGTIEGVLIPSLVAFGASGGTAVLGVLSWRLVNFWLPSPVAALTYLSLRAGPSATPRLPAARGPSWVTAREHSELRVIMRGR